MTYLQGQLAGFDAYHKRSKVCYDDGQEEWISLAKERFRLVLSDTLLTGCTPLEVTAVNDSKNECLPLKSKDS